MEPTGESDSSGGSISSSLAEAATGYSRKTRLKRDPFCLELLGVTKLKKQQFGHSSRIHFALTEKAIRITSSKKMVCFTAEAGMQPWKLPSLQNLVSENLPSVKNLYDFYSDSFSLLKLPTGIVILNSNTHQLPFKAKTPLNGSQGQSHHHTQ